MTAPVYGPATERLYHRLPEVYRDADAVQTNPAYPFKTYISCGTQALDDAEELLERFDPAIDGTSDLVDPTTADVGWLRWLAQLVGVRLDDALSETESRDAVQFASSGFAVGTKKAIADAARSALTGTKYAIVRDHQTDTGVGTVWDVLIITRTSETPSIDAVRDAVLARGAKPAGVKLYFRSYEATWDTLEAQRPEWQNWDDVRWDVIEETGL